MKVSIPRKIVTVRELSQILGKDEVEVLFFLMKEKVATSINDNIDYDTACLVAEELGFEVSEDVGFCESKEKITNLREKLSQIMIKEKEFLKPRPPIVTVMGHVDHGKTTLLDRIRKTSVAEKEVGGITQSIGAYQVKTRNGLVTFIDTPGHEAFSVMRERGAQVTDAVILVVAANDGVREQTKEAISLARAENVPIICAINKIDLPNANVDRVKEELSKEGLTPEDWGGKTQTVLISAKRGTGVDELLDLTALVTDLLDLKANPDGETIGVIIESKLDPKRGILASTIIMNGTLSVGDEIRAGDASGKVRFLENDLGKHVSFAGPSVPVQVSGFRGMPKVGDILYICNSHSDNLSNYNRTYVVKSFKDKGKEGKASLNLIVKADTEGSLDALESIFETLETEKVVISIVGRGTGHITENDIYLAESTNSLVVGFSVSLTRNAEKTLKSVSKKPAVIIGNIIYDISRKIEKAVQILSIPDKIEEVISELEILKVFREGKKDSLVGVKCLSGKMPKGARVDIFRKREKIDSGLTIESIKSFQTEVDSMEEGKEYGVVLVHKNRIYLEVGDIIRLSKIKTVDKNNLLLSIV